MAHEIEGDGASPTRSSLGKAKKKTAAKKRARSATPRLDSKSGASKKKDRLKSKNRLEDPKEAYGLISRLDESASRHIFRRLVKEVQHMVDRKPTHTEQELRCAGESDFLPTIDWGGMQNELSDSVGVYTNIATQGEALIEAHSDVAELRPEGAEWMTDFALEDRRMLRRLWVETDYDIELLFAEVFFNREAFGLGVFFRDSPRTLQWGSVHPSDLIFPAGAKLNVNEWPFAAVRTFYSVHDLLEWTSDSKAATAVGWNVKAVREFLEETVENLFEETSASDYEMEERWDMRMEYRERDKVVFYQILVREWDGSISRHVLAAHQTGGSGAFSGRLMIDNARYLFSRREEFRHMGESICLLPHDIFEKHLQKQTGYGGKSLPFHDARNSFVNMMIARVLIASGLVFRVEDESGIDAWNNVLFGGLSTLLPPEVQLEQVSLQSNIGELSQLQQTLDGIFHAQHRQMGGQVKMGDQSKTLGEAQIQFTEDNRHRTLATAFFFKFLTKFHTARVLGMLSPELPKNRAETIERDRFLLTLERKGVPLEAIYGDRQFPYEDDEAYEERRRAGLFGEGGPRLPEDMDIDEEDIIPLKGIYFVQAEVPLGGGNSVDQRMRLEQVMASGMFGRMSSEAQYQFSRRYVATVLGDWRWANEAFPRERKPDAIEEAARQEAQVENASLLSSFVNVASDDLHMIHMGVHTEFAMGILQAVQQGVKPPEFALESLPALIAHALGAEEAGAGHLQFLQQEVAANPALERAIKEFGSQWNIISNTLRQLQQQVGAAVEAERAAASRRLESLSEEEFKAQKRTMQLAQEQQKMQHDNAIFEMKVQKQGLENVAGEERAAAKAREQEAQARAAQRKRQAEAGDTDDARFAAEEDAAEEDVFGAFF